MKSKDIIKLAALIPFAFALTSCGNKKVDANQYLDIEYNGYDTIGTATYTIDFEKMVEDNPKAFDLDEDSSDRAFERAVDKLEKIMEGKLDKTQGLSNGDKINFEWDVDTDELEDEFPVKMSFAHKEFEVKKLEEGEKFDPFDGFEISFDGVAPNGVIVINQKSDAKISEYYITIDKRDGLSNEDKIKLSLDDKVIEDCIRKGMVPESTEKEITVEGLSSYVTKLDQISDDIIKDIDSKTKESLETHVKNKWGTDEKLTGITPVGNYFLISKQKNMITYNALYSVYKIDLENSDGPMCYYYYSYVPNVVIDADGKSSVDLDYIAFPEGGGSFGSAYGEAFFTDSKKNYYIGYKDINTLFEEKIKSQSDNYTYESTVKQ